MQKLFIFIPEVKAGILVEHNFEEKKSGRRFVSLNVSSLKKDGGILGFVRKVSSMYVLKLINISSKSGILTNHIACNDS